MKKTKIITLIKGLEATEQKAFLKYLKKNYNQKNQIRLYQYLSIEVRRREENEDERLSKKYILTNILGGSKLSDKQLLNLGSALVKKIELFLINQYILEDVFLKNYITARIYEEKQIATYANKQLEIIEQGITKEIKTKGHKIRHFHEAMLLAERRYFSNQNNDIVHKISNLKSALHHLKDYNILRKMKYSCELINRENVLEEKHIIHLDAELKAYKNEQTTTPLFNLYESTYRMLSTKDEHFFYNTKKLVFNKDTIIALDERSLILGYLINMAVYYNSRGKQNYLNQLFELYKEGDRYKILSIDKYITSIRFHNIINITCFLKQYKWLNYFTLKYQPHLPKTTEKEINLLSKGRLSFDKKNYSDVCNVLEGENFSNIYFKIRAKSMVLRSYYEQHRGPEEILPFCKNFTQVIDRNKLLNKKTIEGYLAFISIMKKLTYYNEQIILRKDPDESKEELLDILSDKENIQFRDWLKQKINQL